MTRDEIFAAWAPSESPWSNWIKPALFSHLPRDIPFAAESEPIDLSWVPEPDSRTAIVVDLPGAASVQMGIALAKLGYRPVPIFNAIPQPPSSTGSGVVRLDEILAALMSGAETLRATSIAVDAPPAFLIDADREATHNPPIAGAFDNRSVVFTTDFPSAARLAGNRIERAILVRERAEGLGVDLQNALQPWQRHGIQLCAKWLSSTGGSFPLRLPRRRLWAGIWIRLRVYTRFRRNAAGEFGEFIPHAATG